MTDVDEVLAVEREWTEAHQSGDFATIERLMADDYIRLLPDGSLTGKAGVMATLSDEQRAWGFASGEEYDVRLLGDTAIVIGRWRACGMSSGRRFDDHPGLCRYTCGGKTGVRCSLSSKRILFPRHRPPR